MTEAKRNPYAPPNEPTVKKPASRAETKSVLMVCSYLKWMGAIGLLLIFAFTLLVSVPVFVMELQEGRTVAESLGPFVIKMLLAGCFSFVLWTSFVAPTDFVHYYEQVRWQLILLGVCGFPFFTVPVIFASIHLERARKATLVASNEVE